MSENKPSAWSDFVKVAKYFLENRKASYYKEQELKLLRSLQDIAANTNTKLNFLYSH